MQRLLFILLIIVCPIIVFGQSAKDELEKIHARYGGARDYSFDVSMKVVGSKADYENNISHVVHSQKVNYTSIGSNLTLSTAGEIIIVNDSYKTIQYSKLDKTKKSKEANDLEAFFDALELSKYGKFSYKKIGSDGYITHIPVKKSEYSRYIIVFDAASYKLKYIDYYLTDPSLSNGTEKVRIIYKNENLNFNKNASKYKINYYLKKKGDKIILSEKYKDYHLIRR